MNKALKVMIVEDEAIIAHSLKLDFEALNIYNITLAAKGEDAVKLAHQEKPSLILMDICLAGKMDGIEAAERILKYNKIPIVYITGFATNLIKERAAKTNPLTLIEKPIDMQIIKDLIKIIEKNPN